MLSCVVASAQEGSSQIVLNQGWKLSEAGRDQWMDVRVPSVVQQELLRHGVIEDPFVATNEKKVQWVEERDWVYRTQFEVSEEQLAKDEAVMLFEGLDTYADVSLNGAVILRSDNMFVGHDVAVKNHLKVGVNELKIYFHSPIAMTMPLWRANNFDYPADNDQRAEHLSVFSRKAPYSYGWDWGLRLVTSGIWRPITLRFMDCARVEDFHVEQQTLSDLKASLNCHVDLQRLAKQARKVEVQIEYSLQGRILGRETCDVLLDAETAQVDIPVIVRHPVRWMPNGWGEAVLYDFNAKLMVDGRMVDRAHHRIGLRTVKVVREKEHDGESFYFEVNGIPMFAKGANYIPQDAMLPTVSRDRYERLFEDVVEANMNMLRVWGGGIYEDDLFYDLADEYGILIWQDFMFACTTYPHDEAFMERVAREAEYNIRRLRNHPSLAMWCGNNEIAEALKYWGWGRRYSKEVFEGMKLGYEQLFEKLLPEAVRKWDRGRFYMHSSPMVANWGRPDTWRFGDSHNWGVWHGRQPFEVLDRQIPRFMSEFGFQSFPEMKTIRRFAKEEDLELHSEVMTSHQKSGVGNEIIREYMERDYIVPQNFEDLVYVGQVMQGHGIRRGLEAHRRNKPYCMGTLYWQLNDVWPAVSWSSVDYYGNWKALHYQARRAFEPLSVSFVRQDERFEVWVMSDDLQDRHQLGLEIEMVDFEGRVLKTKNLDVHLSANCSRMVYSALVDDWAKGELLQRTCLVLTLRDECRETIFREPRYFVKPRDLQLPEVDLKVEKRVEEGAVVVEVESETLAKDLFVEVDIEGAKMTDNFFDLLPREKRVIRISSPEIHRGDEIELRFHHLQETML